MFNAASKPFIALFIFTTLLISCSGSDEKKQAEALVAEASALISAGNVSQAEHLLDSLSANFPHQVEAGRAALALRPKIMEAKTVQEIGQLQVMLAATAQYVDSLMPFFNSVPRSEEQLEPYLIHKDVSANWRDRNTAVARVSPAGDFYVISSLAGNSTHHTAISLSADGVTVTSGSVPFDDEIPLSRESVRFSAGKADTLGVFALQMDGRPLSLQFIGPKSSPKAQLSAKEVHAMADSWRLASSLAYITPARSRLEQLKAKLQVARDQQARLTTDAGASEADQ